MSSAFSVVAAAVLVALLARVPAPADAAQVPAPPPHHIDARVAPQEAPVPAQPQQVLRVCADPNNLPFSNERLQGFENEIAALLASELGLHGVAYTWWPQRRGFVRTTLNAGRCDVVMGLPADYRGTWNTRPYYRSAYVFVTRGDRHLRLRSFDDPHLHTMTIGVHVIGDDYANVPPVEALARRGIVDNVRGYTIYGDYSRPDPPRDLLDALVRGDIDVAIAWGPLAGYFARREPVPLAVAPVAPLHDALPMTFAIALGVRRGDARLRDALDQALVRRHADIQRVLARYGVPQIGAGAADTTRGRMQ
jgi:quinoprotein dehydrogenase-associated probable ABC transporter substrate-binding protein